MEDLYFVPNIEHIIQQEVHSYGRLGFDLQQDMAQECRIKIFMCSKQLTNAVMIRTLCRNLCVDYYRKHKRLLECVFADVCSSLDVETVDPTNLKPLSEPNSDFTGFFSWLFTVLSAKDRMVISALLTNPSIVDASISLGWKRSTLSMYILRAKPRWRGLWEQYQNERIT